MTKDILDRFSKVDGIAGFYYKNLVTNETCGFHEDTAFEAASVIKIPVMIELFRRFEDGSLTEDSLIQVHKEDKLPSCGALTYLHNDINITLLDACTLMIILSDNTATNLLIKLLGIDQINQTLHDLGCTVTKVNRLLFDSEKSALGIQNRIAPKEIGQLLEGMYYGKIVSKAASKRMLDILKNQRLNGKMPFFITDSTEIAHKTGEDSGISHDVGIVYTEQPFIAAFCSEQVEVPEFERLIQEVTYELYLLNGGTSEN